MVLANEVAGDGVPGPSNAQGNGLNNRGYTSSNGHHISETGRTTWSVDVNGVAQAGPPMRVVPQVDVGAFNALTLGTPHRERFHSAPNPQPHTPTNGMYAIVLPPRSGSWTGPFNFRGNDDHAGTPGTPQQIEAWKIENGTDVRTTIMLRNVPNRMSFGELKAIVDATSKGKYTFLYLRVDFKRNSNVGYAFIDFANPEDILDFFKHRNNTRWMPNSNRTVQLSYATIQGYDCLVEKFRNSAIMLENPNYRPKLFYTSETASDPSKIGEEREFPPPNNMAKQQRSIQNAGEVGLYTPSNNRMQRDRGRRSQFDRGTPAQLQEEFDFHSSPMQQGQITYPGYGSPAYGQFNEGFARNYNHLPGFINPVYGNLSNGGNGYINAFPVTPRMPGPPLPYPHMSPFPGPPPPYFGLPEFQDPFAADRHTGAYGNGYHGGHGMNVLPPPLRLPTLSAGGRVQSPTVPVPAVAEADESGYNEQPGPHYCPRP